MQTNTINGWWIADKPLGITSAAMVAQIKKQISEEYKLKFESETDMPHPYTFLYYSAAERC